MRTISGIKVISCDCGVQHFVVSGEGGRVLQAMMTAGRKALGEGIDSHVFHAEDGAQNCPVCGAALSIPVAEALDPVRRDFGRWLIDTGAEVDN